MTSNQERGEVRMVACPRPFSMDRVDLQLPAGGSVADFMRTAKVNPDLVFARVFIDDVLIEKAQWEWQYPKPGQTLTVRVVPTGGGGGKDTTRILLQIAVVIAAVVAAKYAPYLLPAGHSALAATFVSATAVVGTSIIGSLKINTLIHAPAWGQLEFAGVCNGK